MVINNRSHNLCNRQLLFREKQGNTLHPTNKYDDIVIESLAILPLLKIPPIRG